MKDETKEEEKLTINDTDIQGTNTEQLEEKLKHINISNLTKAKIRGDGSYLYRAILVSLNQDENKYLELRNEFSNLILNTEIDQEIIEERNCINKKEFAEKVKNANFYGDHPEIHLLSKLLNSIIAIYNESKDRWTIIKHAKTTNPSKLALINFTESTHELGNLYDAFIIQKASQRKIELINKMQNPHNESSDSCFETYILLLLHKGSQVHLFYEP